MEFGGFNGVRLVRKGAEPAPVANTRFQFGRFSDLARFRHFGFKIVSKWSNLNNSLNHSNFRRTKISSNFYLQTFEQLPSCKAILVEALRGWSRCSPMMPSTQRYLPPKRWSLNGAFSVLSPSKSKWMLLDTSRPVHWSSVLSWNWNTLLITGQAMLLISNSNSESTWLISQHIIHLQIVHNRRHSKRWS